MTNQPLFSVLIANYNNGKYLMDAIESVRQQTYTNWEIILVDDGSTDNSHELYKELEQDERIHIFLNDQNHGCGYTKRRCAELANGEICGFLDPDDALLSEALEVMVGTHGKHPAASMIYSSQIIADKDLENQYEVKGKAIPKDKSYLEVISGGPTQFTSFKTQSYNKTNGIDPKFKRAVDQDLYFKLEEVGELVYVDKPLYIYRQGTNNNISLGKNNSRKALCWDLLAMVDACSRRKMSIDKYAFDHVLREMDVIADQAAYEKELEIRNSKTYKMGAFILKPFKRIFKIFKK